MHEMIENNNRKNIRSYEKKLLVISLLFIIWLRFLYKKMKKKGLDKRDENKKTQDPLKIGEEG